jgi:hypothetical protein
MLFWLESARQPGMGTLFLVDATANGWSMTIAEEHHDRQGSDNLDAVVQSSVCS